MKQIFYYLCIALCTALTAACSDNDDNAPATPGEGQGEVIFTFERNQVYSINALNEMVRLKVTLERDGKEQQLPTIDLTGDEQAMVSLPVCLDSGLYHVKKYVAYNNKGVQVQEAYLDEDNELLVEQGVVTRFFFPVSIRILYSNNLLRSTLFGLCTEIFGNDSTLWPKTWREENTDFETWENLVFETDDYGNPTYVKEIIFDSKFAANPETGFEGMKKLPAAVAEMATLESIVIQDIPQFEQLPDNMDMSGAGSLIIMNTAFSEFPESVGRMKYLSALTVINSRMTEIPLFLKDLENLWAVDFNGNDITTFPAELARSWKKLTSLSLKDAKLTSLPEEIFQMERVSIYNFSGNPTLTSLPDRSTDNGIFNTLLLDGCGFTSIPKAATRSGMKFLSMASNKLTSLSQSDLSPDLETLIVDDNALATLPALSHDKLGELSVNRCGLSALPELSALPNLKCLLASGNAITEVPAGCFAACKTFALLDLSDNASLTNFSASAGFTEDAEGKPHYLNCVNVDNCPLLKWTIPASWSHIKDVTIYNKENLPLPDRQVVVYHHNSPGVKRQSCGVSGCDDPNHDTPPLRFDEWMEAGGN